MQSTSNQQLIKIEEGSIISPLGFSAAGLHTKVKRKRNDLGLIYCDVPAESAAVYTLNQITAAPLDVTKKSLAAEGKIQAVIVNSGNANACTGNQGLLDAQLMKDMVAEHLSIPNQYVAVGSTGVIGELMPMDKIIPGISKLAPEKNNDSAEAFNEAIMTTDTCKKSTCYETIIDGVKVTMGGSAKGSGMIAPNMATMFAFVTTDADISHEYLQVALKNVTDETFNRITVDGDTSTNDMVITMASGSSQQQNINHRNIKTGILSFNCCKQVCEDLAIMIARDGEGATKLIEVNVEGAVNDEEAGKVAKSIVGSSLVKTMVYGSDPNWGRVMMAIGKSEMQLDPDKIDIIIGSYPLLIKSQPTDY